MPALLSLLFADGDCIIADEPNMPTGAVLCDAEGEAEKPLLPLLLLLLLNVFAVVVAFQVFLAAAGAACNCIACDCSIGPGCGWCCGGWKCTAFIGERCAAAAV